jgi:hypothetical protein
MQMMVRWISYDINGDDCVAPKHELGSYGAKNIMLVVDSWNE